MLHRSTLFPTSSIVPRAMLDRTSPEYVSQTLSCVHEQWHSATRKLSDLEKYIAELEQCQAWTYYPAERPAGTLEALLRIVIREDTAKALQAINEYRARTAGEMAKGEEQGGVPPLDKPGNPTGSNQHTKNEETLSDNVSSRQGTSSAYLVARIKRDAADEDATNHDAAKEALAGLQDGSIPSARQAAIRAGLVRVPTPLDVARRAWARMGPEDRRAFLLHIAQDEAAAGILRDEVER